MKSRPLILASGSPRRKSLMRKAGFRFRIVPADIEERVPRGWAPSRVVRHLALQKALAVSQRHPGTRVLGADTLVYIKGRIIGKPKNAADAARILRLLSGAWQRVYTGVALVDDGGRLARVSHAVSAVRLRKLSARDVARASREHLDKAGAYAVQQKDDPFVERVVGDFDNVEGLPMRLVKRLLRGGLKPLPKAV